MKKLLVMLLSLCLCLSSAFSEETSAGKETIGIDSATEHEVKPDKTAFTYEHDPRDNPKAMRDIVVNPDAVYGFSPSTAEGSTLKNYADAIDWSDPEPVARAREERRTYHESMAELYDMILAMMDEDKDVETIARAVNKRRNELRMEAEKDNPEGLALVKKRNLETYGNEEGPTADDLYEKYNSWDMVLYKALGTNAGMDACLGFYDEYYYLYDIENEIEAGGI